MTLALPVAGRRAGCSLLSSGLRSSSSGTLSAQCPLPSTQAAAALAGAARVQRPVLRCSPDLEPQGWPSDLAVPVHVPNPCHLWVALPAFAGVALGLSGSQPAGHPGALGESLGTSSPEVRRRTWAISHGGSKWECTRGDLFPVSHPRWPHLGLSSWALSPHPSACLNRDTDQFCLGKGQASLECLVPVGTVENPQSMWENRCCLGCLAAWPLCVPRGSPARVWGLYVRNVLKLLDAESDASVGGAGLWGTPGPPPARMLSSCCASSEPPAGWGGRGLSTPCCVGFYGEKTAWASAGQGRSPLR